MTLPAFHAPTPTDMRRSMGRFTTGVAVVSADDGDGNPSAMTISSLTSISLDPAILLVSLTHGSRTTEAVEVAGSFAVSVLGSRQEALARRFATRGGARFDDLPCDHSRSGLPLIKDALAQLECRVHSAHDIGDFHDFGHDEVPWLF